MPYRNRRSGFSHHCMAMGALILLSASTLLLSSCGNFFSCEGKASCPCASGVTSTTTNPCGGSTGTGTGTGSGTGSSADDYAYVANSSTSNTYLDAYNLGSGALTAVTGSPISLGYSPISMVVTPADTYMYAASDTALNTTDPGVGYIYGYSIASGGALSILGGGDALIEESDASLAVSPDGQWLFTLPIDGLQINEYSINTSTGILGELASYYGLSSASTGSITPISLAVAPSGEYFAAALGTGGANLYPFDTTTGLQTSGQSATVINPANSASGIYAVAFDGNNYFYCAGTAGLEVFSVAPGAVTLLNTYSLGDAPRSIAVNSTSTYVYVGNEGDNTISGYSIGTGGVLTAIPGSPFTAPAGVDALAFDSTGAYLIASGYNSSTGIQLYTIGTGGALSPTASAGTGTSTLIPGTIAATH